MNISIDGKKNVKTTSEITPTEDPNVGLPKKSKKNREFFFDA